MIKFSTQKDFEALNRRKITFCYICGVCFDKSSKIDKDHCIPKVLRENQDSEPSFKSGNKVIVEGDCHITDLQDYQIRGNTEK